MTKNLLSLQQLSLSIAKPADPQRTYSHPSLRSISGKSRKIRPKMIPGIPILPRPLPRLHQRPHLRLWPLRCTHPIQHCQQSPSKFIFKNFFNFVHLCPFFQFCPFLSNFEKPILAHIFRNFQSCSFRYNLRRKSALRPSQSFDTMKSTASSLASDDTLEAAASAKDHLDLATDFPPLSSTDSATDGFVPKWVIKTNQTGGGNGNVSDSNTNNFSSSSNSAVIEDADASDQPLKQPPPDVTVVLQQPASKQCTPGLPDIAAQAPLVMNTTNRYDQYLTKSS